ncbi:DNA cytosine methyltransferase [Micromonospora sp. NBC_01392]|uniref:DNA cytosine methyltransferase n=1 Tax=Micromonospora sp. NBC_01392 TaxID=2903588 RepID=UPI00324484F9
MSTYGVKLQRSDDLRLVPHHDGCTTETFVDWCRGETARGRPLAVDLFSGAGGLSLGLTNAGWTVAAAVDHDDKALATHRANFPGLALDVDLGDAAARRGLIRLLKRVDVDLVAGGPPCQPFSRAGRSKIRSLVEAGVRDEVDHRKELWRSFVEVVLRVRPRAVLMENVPDMALGDELFVVRSIVNMLEKDGYRTQVRLVDAWRFGVPQHRQRLIVLARRDGGAFTWPEETDSPTKLREAISDLPELGLTTGGRVMVYAGANSEYSIAMRDGAPPGVVHDHMTRPVRDDDRAVFALMDSRTLYSDIDPKLRRYKADTFDDKYKRLGWGDLSRSITAHIAKDGYWYIHPKEHRTLTVREAARIQTFPDRFRFAGTRSDAFRQIGNAVPPLLGKAAALAVTPREDLPLPSTDRDLGPVRKRLAQWAAQQRRSQHWYLFPSDQMSPTLAALVAMCRGQTGLGAALEAVRGLASLTPAHLDAISRHPDSTSRLRRAAERLSPAISQLDGCNDPAEIAEKARLQAAEVELFRLLLGEDRLLPNQTTVRVADRVLSTGSGGSNLRTRGRLDLALLVGSGKHAPGRMAAVRLVGATFCKTDQSSSVCGSCPLREHCEVGSLPTSDVRQARATRAAAVSGS